jgi:Proteasome activator PA28, C-terminal
MSEEKKEEKAEETKKPEEKKKDGPSQSAPVLAKQTSSLGSRVKLMTSLSSVPVSLAKLELGPRGRKEHNGNLFFVGLLSYCIILELSEQELNARNESLSQEIQELAHKLEAECFHIIFTIFPAKITKLDAMYKQDPRFSLSGQEVKKAGPLPSNEKGECTFPVADKAKQTNVPCNTAVLNLTHALKEEMLVLQEYMNSLSLWIQLNVPRISDNTSFSQEVQMQLLEEINGAEGVGMDVLDQFAGNKEQFRFVVLIVIVRIFPHKSRTCDKMFEVPRSGRLQISHCGIG